MAVAARWAWAYLHNLWLLILVAVILVVAGVDLETPFWNGARIVALVVSLTALSVVGLNWWLRRRRGEEPQGTDQAD